MRPRSILGLAVLTTVGIACSGSDTATPATTALPATTAASSTIGDTRPTETAPPATDPTTTSPSPSSSTASTTEFTTPATTESFPATTGTTNDDAAARETIIKAFETANVALADPFDADAEAALGKYRTGDSLTNVTDTLAQYRAEGLVERINSEEPSRIELLTEPSFQDLDNASLQVCFINSNILLRKIGDEFEVVNDDIISSRSLQVLTREDGTWKIIAGTILAQSEGAVGCDW